MRERQETGIFPVDRPPLLPGGKEVYLNHQPAREIIELLIKAGKNKKNRSIPREDLMKTLKPMYPDISNKKLGRYIAQATILLKPKGLEIASETTRLKGARPRRYTLVKIGQRSALNRNIEKKPAQSIPIKGNRVPINNKGTLATLLVSPGQKAERLAREKRTLEEAREIFINKFSSIIVSHIANNPDDGSRPNINLEKNLETFLKYADPDFRELIGGDSVEYIEDFFINALLMKLNQWWKLENPSTVPAIEQSAVASCIKLREKGFNIEGVLEKVAKRFSIPTMSVEQPKSQKIRS